MFKAVNRDTQKFRVLEYLNEFPNSSNKEIAEALNIPLNSARGRKSELDKEGFLDTEKEKGKTVRAVATEKAKTEFPELSDDEFARDDFIDREIEPEVQWRRKLLKTGKTSNPKWKTSTNIEIYTFINSDDGKFNSDLYQELYEGVQEEIPFMSEIDSDGYSDNLVDRYEIETEYEYPSANLIINGKRTTVILK